MHLKIYAFPIPMASPMAANRPVIVPSRTVVMVFGTVVLLIQLFLYPKCCRLLCTQPFLRRKPKNLSIALHSCE